VVAVDGSKVGGGVEEAGEEELWLGILESDTSEDAADADEDDIPYNTEGFILDFAMASRLRGKIPDFANPALMLGIENACSKGPFRTLENSLLETTKFFLENERLRTALAYQSFRDLKTETSNGWSAWVVWGGKQNKIMSFS